MEEIKAEEYVVNGKPISKEEFFELQRRKDVRLILVESSSGNSNEYRMLERLYG